jgi:hypothetical protein
MQFVDDLIGNDNSPQFNSRGHRCKELEEVNLHNYFLFAGDNVGLGLDKDVTETYPYIVSKALKTDYYNLCVFNGGVDCLRYNLLTWLNKHKEKPRAIIVSYEFLNSVIVSDHNFENLKYCDLDDIITQDLLDMAQDTGFFKMRNYIADKLITRLVNIPIFQINFSDKQNVFTTNITNIDFDGHTHDHKTIASLLIRNIRMKQEKAKP